MSKKVLITGITGMVGSHLADYLFANSDWEIHGMTRWRSPLDNLEQLTPSINAGARVFLHYADLRDDHAVREVVRTVRPDFVFHLAAQSFPRTSFDSPLDTYDTNVQGTTRVLAALREFAPEAAIHVCASSEVFGRVAQEHLPIGEDAPFHPASPYAISKVGTDLVGRFYAEAYNMLVMTTRMFTHTGPRRGDVFAESSFAKQIAMIEAGLMPAVLQVGNLKSLRTIADVRDAVRAYYLLLTHNPIAGAYYNIGGTHSCQVGEILQTLLALSPYGEKIKIKQDAARMRPIDADLQVPDTSKFSAHTGWTTEIPYQQTMADLLNYWRARVEAGAVVINR
ncbi:MAG: GDP-mannose 4,6-dehydratase [Proteobacteria bacterium]|nr:GDP-mannose 4,6-dehydratase [Pseudomonadota bacterium]